MFFFLTKLKILSKGHLQTKHVKTTHYCISISTVCMYVFVLIYHILKLAFSQFLRSFHRRLLRKSIPSRRRLCSLICVCDSAEIIQHEITSSCFVPISRYVLRSVLFSDKALDHCLQWGLQKCKCIIRTNVSLSPF